MFSASFDTPSFLFPHRFSIQGLRDFVFYTNEQVAVEKVRRHFIKDNFRTKGLKTKSSRMFLNIVASQYLLRKWENTQRTTAAAAERNEKAERKISSLNNTETKENTCCFLDDRCRDVRRRAEVENTDAEIKKKKKANGSMVTTFSRSAFLFSPVARFEACKQEVSASSVDYGNASEGPGAWWEWRWACGGWSRWILRQIMEIWRSGI